MYITAGCENGCSRHGQCTLENGEYRCDCIEGWAGTDCSIALEMDCKDNIDNDGGKLKYMYFNVGLFCGKKIVSKLHTEINIKNNLYKTILKY